MPRPERELTKSVITLPEGVVVRLAQSLMTKDYNNKKLVLANFVDVLENCDESIELAKKAVQEFIVDKNADDLFMRPNEYASSLQESVSKRLW